MSWQSSSLQSSRSLYLQGSDTWSETEGGAGKEMKIFDSFSEIPVQTTWIASRRVCLAVKWAIHSVNENYVQNPRVSLHSCVQIIWTTGGNYRPSPIQLCDKLCSKSGKHGALLPNEIFTGVCHCQIRGCNAGTVMILTAKPKWRLSLEQGCLWKNCWW